MSQQATSPERLDSGQLHVYYMKMTTDNVHARLGKLRAGQVVPLDQATATRYLAAGAAEQVSSGDYEDAQNKRKENMSARQERFRALNDQYAMWDVSTYRDVLTAPEKGLRLAAERGIPLVNVHYLRDENGDPLPPDADVDEILEARLLLNTELNAPLEAHDRSSVMGGGSHYQSNLGPSGPLPLNPGYRAMAERIAENEVFAERRAFLQDQPNESRSSGSGSGSARTSRAARRGATLHGSQSSGEPGVSPQAAEQAQNHGVTPPTPPRPEQKA